MCGLFGMIATTTTLPQGEVTTLAREAGRRGPNAWGVSWVQPDGTLVRTTQSEALKAHPERLFASVPRMCRAFIGQTRLSTSGTYHEARNNPPFIVGIDERQVAIAHNGNVYNAGELIERYGLIPQSECDSEVLGLLIAQGEGSLVERVQWALSLLDGRSPYALLVLSQDELVTACGGHPLYRTEGPSWLSFCSRPLGDSSAQLPGGVWSWPVEEGRAVYGKDTQEKEH